MRFLVESSFRAAPTPEILALIPAEMAHSATLDRQGIRERLYVAADNSRAWQVLRADSAEAIQSVIDSFPLAPYIGIKITELADDMETAGAQI